jgi:4-amino-4-deoxy-L-arabinose transferase-like glycosyltransferase
MSRGAADGQPLRARLLRATSIHLAALLALLVGLAVRLIDLDKNPPGFFCDEASIGYNAYSLLTTGKDEWGTPFPVFFRAFGEYKNPLDIYFTVPIVAMFGLSEFSVRLTSVIFASLSMVALYYLGSANGYLGWTIGPRSLGLILLSVFAITPWSIHLSRTNLEGLNILVFFTVLSLLFITRFTSTGKTRDLLLFSASCALATYSYFPARITTPLFLGIIAAYLAFTRGWRVAAYAVAAYIVPILPLLHHLTSETGLARWQQVSMFNQPGIDPVRKLAESYLLHFSPDFLFMHGDSGMPGQAVTRHSVAGIGELYRWQGVFIPLGAYAALRRGTAVWLPVFALLLLYPVPSSMTADLTPQATRSVAGIVPFTLLTGYGIAYLLEKVRGESRPLKLTVHTAVVGVGVSSFIGFLQLQQLYPSYAADFWGWQYGPRDIVRYFLDEKDQYDELYMTGSFNAPQIFLKFYDPERKCPNCFIGGLDRWNKEKKQLFALRVEEVPPDVRGFLLVKKVIYYPDGRDAFYIGEWTGG